MFYKFSIYVKCVYPYNTLNAQIIHSAGDDSRGGRCQSSSLQLTSLSHSRHQQYARRTDYLLLIDYVVLFHMNRGDLEKRARYPKQQQATQPVCGF